MYDKVITTTIESTLSLLLDFDLDGCCVAYDPDKSKVVTTPRGMRALKHAVNIVDTRFMSSCYWRRLEKYSERGFAIGVPGMLKERVSKAFKNNSYVFVQQYGLLLQAGPMSIGKETSINLSEPLAKKCETIKLTATAQQHGKIVKDLGRVIILDQGLAKHVNIPSQWVCEKHERVVCDGKLSGSCTPISTGDGEYDLLWGIEPTNIQQHFEDDDVEFYEVTPMAMIYGILDKTFQQTNAIPDGWFKGGVMQKLTKKMTKSNTSGVYKVAIESNASRTIIGEPLRFVYDIVGADTNFKDLKYILDAAQLPLRDDPNFEKVYGITRHLCFKPKHERVVLDVDMFEHIY